MIGEMNDADFFDRLCVLLDYTESCERLKRIWTECWSPILERLELVEDLSQQFRLGIISNISRFHSDYLEANYLNRSLFTVITYSWECGFMKPRPEIFHKSRAEIGLPPEQCLFVDDQHRHVEAAKVLGWNTLCINLEDNLRNQLAPLIAARVHSH